MDARNQLHAYRLHMQSTQAFMAHSMGVPLRTYEDLETGRTVLRDVHLNAARYACITIAIAQGGDGALLPEDVRQTLASVLMLADG